MSVNLEYLAASYFPYTFDAGKKEDKDSLHFHMHKTFTLFVFVHLEEATQKFLEWSLAGAWGQVSSNDHSLEWVSHSASLLSYFAGLEFASLAVYLQSGTTHMQKRLMTKWHDKTLIYINY